MKSKTATEVCKVMQTVFARFGIPEKVISENGPPFNSAQYVMFAQEWGFEIKNSSPKYPQSNGEAERAVQTV
jgi:transposase InsO family protein